MTIKKTLAVAGILFSIVNVPAQDAGSSAIAALQLRIDTLEKKISCHDSCIVEQKKIIVEQVRKVTSHDTTIEELKNTLHRQFGTPAIQGQGFTLGVNATMILQGTDNPNAITTGSQRVGDASYAAEVTFKKDFNKIGGKAFMRYEAGEGKGIDEDLSLLSFANASAYPGTGIWVAEAWYEQKLFEDKFDGTIGLLFPAAYFDNNNVANDQTTQFLSGIFVNNPTLEMPLYIPGVAAKFAPVNGIEIAAAAFSADAQWHRIGDKLFDICQLTMSPTILGSQGNYRFFGWYNGVHHQSWNNTESNEEGSFGFGLSFDQQIAEVITAFVRAGWRNPNTYDSQAVALSRIYSTLVSASWSAGVQIAGTLWHRNDDITGIAVGQAFASNKFTTAMALKNSDPETHVEMYYRIKCFEHMGISPDLQYIVNPFRNGTQGNTANIAIVGIRSMVDF